MPIDRIDDVQLAMPPGGEDVAIAFYEGLLGIRHVPKPAHLAVRGGCWFDVTDDEPLAGCERVYVDDPFGNRIEMIEPIAHS